MTSLEGSVVTIYNGKEADMGKLEAVLNQPDIRNLPLVIVPVAGEFRTGKSFLLSYFLRYLINKNFGNEDEELVGFDHKYSTKSVTEGIKIWDQPLIVKGCKEDGSEQSIVVLLMDSQGILGSKGGKEMATRIFALSTMVSSIIVFNLMGQLNEGILEHLELFTAYAKQATTTDTNETPFLKLLLLIRDWGKKDVYDYGLEGGKKYVDEYFEGEDTKTFDSFFQDTQCFLMPKPGDCVDDKHYNGCLGKLTNNFKKYLQILAEDILNHQHLTRNMKKVGGLTITAGDFCVYFQRCTELMDNMDWNKSTNILKMNATFNCELAQKAAVNCYKVYMTKEIASFVNKDKCLLMTSEELDNIGKNATDEAQKKFRYMSTFSQKNDSELYEEYEAKMNQDLDHLFVSYKHDMDIKKQDMDIKKQDMEIEKLDMEIKKRDMEIKEEKEKRHQLEREHAERQGKEETKKNDSPNYLGPIGSVVGGAIGGIGGKLGGAAGAGLGQLIGGALDYHMTKNK